MCHVLQEAILDSTKDRLICPSSMCQAALLTTLQWSLPLCKAVLDLFICLLRWAVCSSGQGLHLIP